MPSAFADASADVGEFSESVEWFRERFPVTDEILEALGEYAGARAWTIAAVTELDVISDAHRILTESIASGRPLRETVELLRGALASYGFDGHRLETIALTNMASAYGAGRYQQLQDPVLIAARPWRQFDGIEDMRQSDICRERNQVTLLANDPWWLTNWPPLHHRCRSQVRSLSDDDVEDIPLERRQPPDGAAADGFGLAPDVQLPWRPDLQDYPEPLRARYLQLDAERAERRLAELREAEDALRREAERRAQREREDLQRRVNRPDLGGFASALERGDESRSRGRARAWLESNYGLTSTDIALSRPGASMLREYALEPDIAGFHQWDGSILIEAETRRRAAAALRASEAGLTARFEDANALQVLLHEELHGMGPGSRSNYVALTGARTVEEVVTDVIANDAIERIIGARAFAGSSYQHLIGVLSRVLNEYRPGFVRYTRIGNRVRIYVSREQLDKLVRIAADFKATNALTDDLTPEQFIRRFAEAASRELGLSEGEVARLERQLTPAYNEWYEDGDDKVTYHTEY